MKKICVLIVCMMVCGAALFAQTASGFETMPDGNGVVITKYKGPGGAVVIPASIGGKSVTAIGESAFQFSAMTSVTIPESVTTIGESAFYACKSLASVTIPVGVTTIGRWVFGSCDSLKAISVSAQNRRYQDIDGVLFTKDGKTLHTYPAAREGTAYTIPAGVTTIGSHAFYVCAGLASVTIPASVTTIGESAFSGCRSFPYVTIPTSVTTIGSGAFSGCKGLTSVRISSIIT